MAIFSDSLTPEEAASQFSLSEVDNESFALEQLGGTYPGAIPAVNPDTILNSMNEDRAKWPIETGYDDDNTSEPEIVESEPPPADNPPDIDENVAPAETAIEAEEAPEAWQEADIAEEQIPEEPDITEVTEETTETVEEAIDAEEEIEEAEVVSAEPATPDPQAVETISSIDDIFNMPQDGGNRPQTNVSNIEEAETTPVAPMTVQIDDSLRSLLMEDLEEEAAEKPVATPETAETTIEADNNTEKESSSIMDISEESEPVATPETAETTTEADNNTELDELSWDSETNEVKTTQKTNKKVNIADKKRTIDKDTDMTEEEEKNTTKKFAMILVIVAVVMIFIIGGIIGYLYLSNKGNIHSDTQADTTAVAESHNAPKASDTTAHEPPPKDSAKADTNVAADTSKVATVDTNKQQQIVEERPQVPKPPVVTEQPRKPRNTPQRRPATTKSNSNTQVAQGSTTTKSTQQSTKEPVDAIYSIQMYSSPSKSDAEERLVLLARKNITGYITTQQIKGQTWYRVRFGRYNSYDEAVTEVTRLNIKDAWIERVR